MDDRMMFEPAEDQTDVIDPTSLSDEELEKHLSGEGSEENIEASAEEETPEETVGSEEEVSEEGSEPSGEESPVSEEEESSSDTIDSELEKLRKRVQDKEEFIQRQAREIGELRKLVREALGAETVGTEQGLQQKGEEGLNDEVFFEKPVEAVKKTVEQILAERERQIQAEAQRALEVEKTVKERVPDFEKYIDEIAELAKEDGYPDEAIAAFKANPYMGSDPHVLLSYARRVEAARQLNQLKAELEKAKKAPEEFLKKIQKAASGTSTLSNVAPSTPKDRTEFSEKTITSLSDAELDKLLNEKLRGG